MSYEVRDDGMVYDVETDEAEWFNVDEAEAHALDVLRAAGWGFAIEDEYGDTYYLSERHKMTVPYRDVARSPWRKWPYSRSGVSVR